MKPENEIIRQVSSYETNGKIITLYYRNIYLDDEEDLQDFKDEVNVYISPPMLLMATIIKDGGKPLKNKRKTLQVNKSIQLINKLTIN